VPVGAGKPIVTQYLPVSSAGSLFYNDRRSATKASKSANQVNTGRSIAATFDGLCTTPTLAG
jgi:hypothetical protein